MKTRFRTNWFGKLILQVCVEWEDDGMKMVEWRDATLSDFTVELV